MSEALHLVARVAVPVFIVSTMLAMGLGLTPAAVGRPLRSVRLVVAALAVNFVVAPGVAYLMTVAVPLERPYAVGLILFACAAGAPFLPKLVETARGDLPLAAALMTLLTVVTISFLPLALPLLLPGFQASPWSIARPLLALMVLPLAAAMLVRHRSPRLAERWRPVLGAVGSISLTVLVVLIVGLNAGALLGVVGSGALALSLLFTAVVFAAGYVTGGRRPEVRGVLGLASAARNVGAALPMASALPDPKVTVMVLVATIACLTVSFAAAGVLRRRQDRRDALPSDVGAAPKGGS